MRFETSKARGARLAATLAVLLCGAPSVAAEQKTDAPSSAPSIAADAKVELNEKQAASIKVAPLGEMSFAIEIQAFGSVDFNEDLSVQLFPPFQGRIIEAYAKLGDDVKKGQTLYTIASPDLIQAEGTLIEAAATYELTSKALARDKVLLTTEGLAQKDFEQAIADQQNADGALKAARDAVMVFGKSSAEIDRIIAGRKVDPVLVVASPVRGRITARNAQPGLFVQPGTSTAPYNVADLSTVWLIANVSESDSPALRVGQPVKASVTAYPGRVFEGKLTHLGTSVDPAVHTVIARAEIEDPKNELRPGMMAIFQVAIAPPQRSPALPVNGLVREGDGTMTAWLTTDNRHFQRRIITVGVQQGGYRQVLDGLKAGDHIVTDGAILLSNMAAGGGTPND